MMFGKRQPIVMPIKLLLMPRNLHYDTMIPNALFVIPLDLGTNQVLVPLKKRPTLPMLGAKVAMAPLASMLKNLMMKPGTNLLILGKLLVEKHPRIKNLGWEKRISFARNAMISIMMLLGRTKVLNENGLK